MFLVKNQKREHPALCSENPGVRCVQAGELPLGTVRPRCLLSRLLSETLPSPQAAQVGSSPGSFTSFFGLQETYITHGFQLTIRLGEQEHKRKHVYVPLALLQRRGLDVADLFSTISGWPPPSSSPRSLGKACCWLGTAAGEAV